MRLIVKEPFAPKGLNAETLMGLPLTLKAKDSFAVPRSMSRKFVVAEKVTLSNRQGPFPLKVNWMASLAPRLSICGSVSEIGMLIIPINGIKRGKVPSHVTPRPKTLSWVMYVLVIVIGENGPTTGMAVRVVPP